MNIDMSRPADAGYTLTPGVDLWQVLSCEAGRNKGGEVLKFKFARVSNTQDHLYDNMGLEGGGWKYSRPKLVAMLGEDFNGNLDPIALVGKRFWIETEVTEYKEKKRLSVLTDGVFQDVGGVPSGMTAPTETEEESPW